MSTSGPTRSEAASLNRLKTSQPGPIDSLTSLRGFLALWVVFFHFWKDILALFPSVDFLSPVAKEGYLAVPVFFILSGFVLAYNYAHQLSPLGIRSFGRFLLLRLARIYPVHLFTLLVVVGMIVVGRAKGWQLSDAGYGAGDFVLNVFLAQTWVPNYHLNWNYPSWSISSEWFAYLCFPLICVTILRRITTPFRAYAFLGLCWSAMVGLYGFGNEIPFRPLIQVIPTFLAGTAIFACLSRESVLTRRRMGRILWSLGRRRRWLRVKRTIGKFGPDLVLLILAAIPFLLGGYVMVSLLLTTFLVLVYRLAAQRSNCTRFWTNRFAIYLGEVSYSLYMAHALAQKICYKLLPANQFSTATLTLRFGVLLAYVLTIAICVLGTYYLVEKPSRNGLRNLISGSAQKSAFLCFSEVRPNTSKQGTDAAA